jgi:hypothetical protein
VTPELNWQAKPFRWAHAEAIGGIFSLGCGGQKNAAKRHFLLEKLVVSSAVTTS